MKLLTVAIPCYNSQEYMEKSIRSALHGGERVEIIIVDDGSSDDTLAIANRYQEKYPTIVKVVHQENGGHGSAVNAGIRNATGLYFKVLDSDDRLGKTALAQVLDLLENMVHTNTNLDMLVSNYLYDKQGVKHKKMMQYRSAMPRNKIFGWDELRFGISQYLLMHSVIYKTDILRQCKLELPKHTFYVDSIYVFQPLPYVKDIYYLDVCLYKYYIGREDQSVQESIMIKRLAQQYRVTEIMLDVYNNSPITHKNVDHAMVHYFNMMMCVCSILAIRDGSDEKMEMMKELWNKLKESNPELYKKTRNSVFGVCVHLPGKAGKKTAVSIYKIANKIFGFN